MVAYIRPGVNGGVAVRYHVRHPLDLCMALLLFPYGQALPERRCNPGLSARDMAQDYQYLSDFAKRVVPVQEGLVGPELFDDAELGISFESSYTGAL